MTEKCQDIAYLLHQKTKEKLGYGYTLKDIVEKEAREDEEEAKEKKKKN